MRYGLCILLFLVVALCANAGPVEDRVRAACISRVDFYDADLAEVITWLIDEVNSGWRTTESIGLVKMHDSENEKKRVSRQLSEVCKSKRVTLRMNDCKPLRLLTILTDLVGLHYEFRNDRIVLLSAQGEVLVK